MTGRWLRSVVGTSLRGAVADRGGLVVSTGFYVVVTAVLAALWAAAAHANGGDLEGYDARALAWYIVASEAATVALNIRMIQQIGDDIGTGAIAVELLRPAPVLGVRVATELGRTLPRLLACVVAGTLLGLATVGSPPNAVGALLAAPALVLAVACNITAQHAFAALAFWLRDAKSTWYLYQKFVFIAGGMLIPIELFPPAMQSVVKVLPFVAMSYVPARLLSGAVEPHLLAVQAGWLVVLSGVATGVFAAGQRRLQVVGG